MENYYSILGVSDTSTQNEIKRAYLKLAQKYHPDHFTDVQKKQHANEQFSKITAAYRTLCDEKLRREYDKSLESGAQPKDSAREIQAKNAFMRAIAFLKQGDPWRATNLLRIACRYNSQPLYFSYLGLALVYTKQYRKEGFEKLNQAIKELMFNPILYVNLGLAHEFVGNRSEALQAYYEAMNWDPKNIAAKSGIDRLQQQKKGFLSKLFRGKK
jgi:curved DNA-binding protein CbpA